MPRRYGTASAGGEGERLLDVARCDHYPHDDDDNNDEDDNSGLAPVGGGRRKKRRPAGKCGALATWLLPPLIVLTAISLYYSYRLQHQLTAITDELHTATNDISSLSDKVKTHSKQLKDVNATLADHAKVIARFENSVSNSDVLEKLAELEEESKEREERVEKEMQDTKEEIRTVLDETKSEIDQSVSDATDEIHSQVQTVRSALSGYIRETQDQFSTENSFMIYQLAGTITLIGCLISMWHMTSHLRNFRQPFVQRKILAILWMCPIYSVTSWLSLVVPSLEGYLAILKDLYEAYVIYQFLSFLIAVLSGKDGDRTAVVELLAKHADHLNPPVRCFGCCRKRRNVDMDCEEEKRQLADDVLHQCQVFAMQFVFLRPTLTATLFALKKLQYHGPMFGPGSPFDRSGDCSGDVELDECTGTGGMMDYRSPQFYLVILQNVSVFLAFSGLLKFYHAVQDDLAWCRPFPKFLCIKGVVFMTFWQGLVISLLASFTDILSSGGEAVAKGNGGDEDQVEVWAKQAQNFLICIEMLGFSIAHFYCFPVEEWEEGYRPVEEKGKFGDNMALGDFVHDLKLILRRDHRKKRLEKEKSGMKPSSEDSITTVLEEDEELGHSDSTAGLQHLLDDVEDLLDTNGGAPGTPRSNAGGQGKASTADTPRTAQRKNIHQSLEAMNAPAELRQATALLLAGRLLDEETARLLTSDILDQPMESASNDEEDAGVGGVGGSIDDGITGDSGGVEEAVAVESSGGHDATMPSSATPEEQLQPSESTSLLSLSSENDELLRPSIFTMHSGEL